MSFEAIDNSSSSMAVTRLGCDRCCFWSTGIASGKTCSTGSASYMVHGRSFSPMARITIVPEVGKSKSTRLRASADPAHHAFRRTGCGRPLDLSVAEGEIHIEHQRGRLRKRAK